MTDRELLELAAKAAGMTLGKHTQKDWAFTYGGKEWNPITDDGDAFRLAVKLRIGFGIDDWGAEAVFGEGDAVLEENITDPYAATRRAITRAAAEIGEGMT